MQRSSSVMTSPLWTRLVISAKAKLLEAYRWELLKKHEVMSSDELPCFLDEKLRRVDAFELKEPQSVHDLLLVPSPVSSPRARSTGSTSFRGTWSCSASICGDIEASDKSSVCLLKRYKSYAKCKASTCTQWASPSSLDAVYCTVHVHVWSKSLSWAACVDKLAW